MNMIETCSLAFIQPNPTTLKYFFSSSRSGRLANIGLSDLLFFALCNFFLFTVGPVQSDTQPV